MENRYDLSEELLRSILKNAYINGCLVFSDLEKILEPDERNKIMQENQSKVIDHLIEFIYQLKQ